MADVTVGSNRLDGTFCTTRNGNPIVWRGHACEGANLGGLRDDCFCLWTRCGKDDVPANAAKEGQISDIHCSACLEVLSNEKKA